MNTRRQNQGQALISVLFMAIVGLAVFAGAIASLTSAFDTTNKQHLGRLALETAEAGAQNAIMRYLRDPSYTGETFVLDTTKSAVVTVSTASGVAIQSIGTVGTVSRKVSVTGTYENLILTITSWREIP